MEENESLSGIQAAGAVNQQGDDAAKAGREESTGDAGRSRQSHEENRQNQAARKAGEKAGYERAMREVNQRIYGVGMRDPATGETIGDLQGLERYSKNVRQKQIEARAKAEGRSVAEVTEEEDNRDFLRRARTKEAEEEKKQEAERSRQDFIARDAAAFVEAFPDVDLEKLDQSKAFRRFCGSRYGKEPLAELYEDYLEVAGEAARSAVQKQESRKARSTGAGGGEAASESLTAAQQRELDEWNRNYPQMKMTAAEFLKR